VTDYIRGNIIRSDEWLTATAPAFLDSKADDGPGDFDEAINRLERGDAVTQVRLEGWDLGDEELERVVALVSDTLECLDISRNFHTLTDECMVRLINSGKLARLRMLNLDNCYTLGDATLDAITQGHLPALEALSFSTTLVTNDALVRLGKSDGLPKLAQVFATMLRKADEAGLKAFHETPLASRAKGIFLGV
jgi:hypothetical protein